MVDFDEIDTREERRQFTRDNDVAIISRRDGSTQVVDERSGRVTSEFSRSGRRRARTVVDTDVSDGSNDSRAVTSQQEAIAQDAVVAERQRQSQLQREEERALREGNISLEDGSVGRVDIIFPEDPANVSSQLRPDQDNSPLTVRASTPEEIRALRRQENPFVQFGRGVIEGVTVDESLVNLQNPTNSFAEDARGFGQIIGLVGGGFAARGIPRAAGATRAATQTAVRGTRVGQALEGTSIGARTARFGVGLTEGVGQSVAIVGGARGLNRATLSRSEREVLRDPRVQEAVRRAREAERASTREGGVDVPLVGNVNPRAAGFELVGTALSGEPGTRAFASELESSLRSSTLSSRQQSLALDAALDERRALNSAELVAFANIARFSEGFGRREVNQLFFDDALELTGRRGLTTGLVTAPSIGTAGFIEGFSQETAQQLVRARDFDVRDAATMGGFGAVSAATLGGVIAGGSAINSRTTRAVEAGSLIADPFERPGDIIQENFERSFAQQFGRGIRDEPNFVGDGLVREVSPAVRNVELLPRSPVITAGQDSFTLSAVLETGGIAPVPIRTPSQSPASTIVGSPAPVPSPTDTPAPVPVPTNIPVPVPAPVPSDTIVPIPSNVGVPVPAPVPAPVPVPITVISPEQGALPFFPFQPLGSPAPQGRARRARRRRTAPTRSVFQSLFDIVPEDAVFRQSGQSEMTGLLLRDF